MALVFQKVLKRTDIDHRLAFPTMHLGVLPSFAQDKNDVKFDVRYGDEGPVYTFSCIKRNGEYRKPTIQRGWSDVVRDKQLQTGDELRFYVEGGQHEPKRFQIEVWRLDNSDPYGET